MHWKNDYFLQPERARRLADKDNNARPFNYVIT